MSEYFIGVDLGGTKILTAIADEKGAILSSIKVPTEASKGQEVIIENICNSVYTAIEKADIAKEEVVRLGIGSPGPLNSKEGIIYENANLPWKNVPIVKLLEERLDMPVLLENDANAAALGEKWFGAGRDVDNMLYVTVSTGIGGGIIVNKKIYHGAFDIAGEVGHMIIDPSGPICGCGNHGCLEAFASGTAINRMGKEAVREDLDTILVELSAGDPEKVDGRLISQAAEQGDLVAKDIWNKAGNYLGIGIANLLNILNPEMVVLGGGVMKAGDLLMNPMIDSLKKYAFESAITSTKICQAVLGDDVGVKGAIAVALGDRLLS